MSRAHESVAIEKLETAFGRATDENAEMYSSFRHTVAAEAHNDAVREIDAQIAELKEHAARFAVLVRASERQVGRHRASRAVGAG